MPDNAGNMFVVHFSGNLVNPLLRAFSLTRNRVVDVDAVGRDSEKSTWEYLKTPKRQKNNLRDHFTVTR